MKTTVIEQSNQKQITLPSDRPCYYGNQSVPLGNVPIGGLCDVVVTDLGNAVTVRVLMHGVP